MCGIAGLINTDGQGIDIRLLGRMTDLIAHRGPDGQGFLLGRPGTPPRQYPTSADLAGHQGFVPSIGLGHRRLAILDLSPAGAQPMSNADGTLWIVFNGEVFNYVELQAELRELGATFHTGTDTEVILAAYAAWGDDCVSRFRGMWAFAIWDRRNNRLFCSRDRWGIKPFYYRWSGGSLGFASEIKQLIVDTRPFANPAMLFDWSVLGTADHMVECCFDGILKLPPAHNLTLELAGGSPVLRRYYELAPKDEYARLGLDEAVKLVRETLSESVRIRMRSDVPVGSCLSGGVDSSSIVALMRRHRQTAAVGGQQHTFTFVCCNKRWDESAFADMVVKATGVVPHAVLPSQEEVQADVLKMLWHQEQPIYGLSPLAQWSVFKAARQQGVPVVLDGQGGDEMFLGYSWYNSAVLRDMLSKGQLLAALRHYLLTSRRSQAGYVQQFIEMLYLQTSVFRGLHLGHRGSQWLKKPFMRSQSMLGRLANLRLPADLLEMQIQQIYSTVLPALLRYEDRNSMAFAVESRLPMLDYKLVELAISLPWQYKNREGWTKYVLRQAVSELLPKPVVWRRNKFGFAAPQQEWMAMLNGQVASLLREELACSAIVDVDRVRRDFASGKIGQKVLWRFFNLEHWMRMFSVQI